jgi:hypothetical protein
MCGSWVNKEGAMKDSVIVKRIRRIRMALYGVGFGAVRVN